MVPFRGMVEDSLEARLEGLLTLQWWLSYHLAKYPVAMQRISAISEHLFWRVILRKTGHCSWSNRKWLGSTACLEHHVSPLYHHRVALLGCSRMFATEVPNSGCEDARPLAVAPHLHWPYVCMNTQCMPVPNTQNMHMHRDSEATEYVLLKWGQIFWCSVS